MTETVNEKFLKEREAKIKKEREENSKYFQLRNGENIVKIDLSQLPIETAGKYGLKYVWQTMTEKNGVKLLLSASPTLDALITKALSNHYNPFTLIKLGESKDTRYAIKEFGEE